MLNDGDAWINLTFLFFRATSIQTIANEAIAETSFTILPVFSSTLCLWICSIKESLEISVCSWLMSRTLVAFQCAIWWNIRLTASKRSILHSVCTVASLSLPSHVARISSSRQHTDYNGISICNIQSTHAYANSFVVCVSSARGSSCYLWHKNEWCYSNVTDNKTGIILAWATIGYMECKYTRVWWSADSTWVGVWGQNLQENSAFPLETSLKFLQLRHYFSGPGHMNYIKEPWSLRLKICPRPRSPKVTCPPDRYIYQRCKMSISFMSWTGADTGIFNGGGQAKVGGTVGMHVWWPEI